MKREVNQKILGSSRDKDEASKLLGKRHEFDGAVRPNLGRTARTIGFTPKEVLELERIYQAKPKDTKR